jgi:cytochrome c oxidase cbb3-type subunit I/II
MLGQLNEAGTGLKYEFVETLKAIQLPFILRTVGGLLYLVGFGMCAVNIWKTARSGAPHNETVEVTPLEGKSKDNMSFGETFGSEALVYTFAIIFFTILAFFLPPHADKVAIVCAVFFTIKAVLAFKRDNKSWAHYHEKLLENYLPFAFLTFIAAAIGGVVQIIPSIVVNKAENVEGRVQELYTPLELAGRDLYISEGCYNCHSQMIRTLVPDVMRYGRVGRTDMDVDRAVSHAERKGLAVDHQPGRHLVLRRHHALAGRLERHGDRAQIARRARFLIRWKAPAEPRQLEQEIP